MGGGTSIMGTSALALILVLVCVASLASLLAVAVAVAFAVYGSGRWSQRPPAGPGSSSDTRPAPLSPPADPSPSPAVQVAVAASSYGLTRVLQPGSPAAAATGPGPADSGGAGLTVGPPRWTPLKPGLWPEPTGLRAAQGARFIPMVTRDLSEEVAKRWQEVCPSVPDAVPDDYTDAITEWAADRKARGVRSLVIRDGSNAISGSGSARVAFRYGPNTDRAGDGGKVRLSAAQLKRLFCAASLACDALSRVLELGRGRSRAVDAYLMYTGMDASPRDRPGVGGWAWLDMAALAPCGTDQDIAACVVTIVHELTHVLDGGAVRDNGTYLSECLAEFVAALFTPSQPEMYRYHLRVNCDARALNYWSRYNLTTGTCYSLTTFWLFIACRYGLRAFVDMFWGPGRLFAQGPPQDMWAAVAGFLGQGGPAELAAQYLVDVLTCAYFRQDQGRLSAAAAQFAVARNSPYYDKNLLWKFSLSLSTDYSDVQASAGARVTATPRTALEPYGYDVHSLSDLMARAGLDPQQPITLRVGFSPAAPQGDPGWVIVLMRRVRNDADTFDLACVSASQLDLAAGDLQAAGASAAQSVVRFAVMYTAYSYAADSPDTRGALARRYWVSVTKVQSS